jgi:hypothetical protein
MYNQPKGTAVRILSGYLSDVSDERDRLREAAVKAREAISLCVQAARPLAIAADPWFKKAEYATAALDEALGEKP